jgi:hypothetical protein
MGFGAREQQRAGANHRRATTSRIGYDGRLAVGGIEDPSDVGLLRAPRCESDPVGTDDRRGSPDLAALQRRTKSGRGRLPGDSNDDGHDADECGCVSQRHDE